MFNTYRMSQVMTPWPITVRPSEKLDRAKQLMEKHRVRHLPVTVRDNEIVGMLSERDLHLARHHRYPESLRVIELMKEHPYCVPIDAYTYEALRLMADFKAEAIAVITGRRTLHGIFTRHDALKIMNGMVKLREPLKLAA